MTSTDEGRESSTRPPMRGAILPGAVGLHLGLAVVCCSAVYTGWQRSIITAPQWGVILLLAASLVVAAVSRREVAAHPWARLGLALAALWVLRLCYDPQLEALAPGVAGVLPGAFMATCPGLSLIGVLIVLLAGAAYVRAAGRTADEPRFAAATVTMAGLLVACSLVAYALLRGPHELPAAEMLRPVLTVIQGGVLVYLVPAAAGGPAVGRTPYWLLALTLVLAFARNMAFPME